MEREGAVDPKAASVEDWELRGGVKVGACVRWGMEQRERYVEMGYEVAEVEEGLDVVVRSVWAIVRALRQALVRHTVPSFDSPSLSLLTPDLRLLLQSGTDRRGEWGGRGEESESERGGARRRFRFVRRARLAFLSFFLSFVRILASLVSIVAHQAISQYRPFQLPVFHMSNSLSSRFVRFSLARTLTLG